MSASISRSLIGARPTAEQASKSKSVNFPASSYPTPAKEGIDIVVSRLRLKIERNPREPDFVQTVRSSGYIFSPAVETVP